VKWLLVGTLEPESSLKAQRRVAKTL